jgi:hypothetical protein
VKLLAGVPPEVTVTASGVAKAVLTAVLCGVVPVFAVIATTGGGVVVVVELELLQLVRSAKVEKTNNEENATRIFIEDFRFTGTPLSAQPSGWRAHGIGARRERRACFVVRIPGRPLLRYGLRRLPYP